MRKISGACSETELIESEGPGFALAVELASAGDEDAPVSGVFLCRKGINALPEFAEGFGFDTSSIIEGLEPERYQVRVEMLLSYNGKLLYGDGNSEFQLSPGKKVRFVIPLPFQGYDYFLNSPPEDLFIVVASVTEDETVVEVSRLHEVMRKAIEAHGHLGSQFNVHFSLLVPQIAPPSEEMMTRVGQTNKNPIRPMPNT